MRINHNLASLNTYRQLSTNSANGAKSLEKLSSGLRINKAGDDAAGLAVSEKMRGQIRGLDQASSNAQNGISLLQTAEGALNETHSILQRMRELAVQSSTDTNTGTDRSEIQKEVDQLASEITRIANTTEFNTQKLLNGGVKSGAIGSMTFQIGANAGQNLSLSVNAMDAKTLGVARDTQVASMTTTGTAVTDISLATGTGIPSGVTGITAADVAAVAAVSTAVVADGSAHTVTMTATAANGAAANAITFNFGVNTADSVAATQSGNIITINFANTDDTKNNSANIQAAVRGLGNVNGVDVSGWTAVASGNIAHASVTGNVGTMGAGTAGVTAGINVTATNGGNTEVVKVATNATSVAFSTTFNGLTLTKNAAATSAASFGTTNITVVNSASTSATFASGAKTADAVVAGGINVSTQSNADAAITKIQTAIETVSAERSKLGALQNRFEHTIANLGTSSENLTAAESRVRDVDMAKEMMEFTKNNILSQAAQAMLAQANQQPQGVLQLLR